MGGGQIYTNYMNFYNQIPRSTFVVIDGTGTLDNVSVHSFTPPTVEEVQLEKTNSLAEKHKLLAEKQGKFSEPLCAIGIAMVSLGTVLTGQSWIDSFWEAMVLGVGAFLVGVYCAVLSHKKQCAREMHERVSADILSSSSYEEARKIDARADDWVWWRG